MINGGQASSLARAKNKQKCTDVTFSLKDKFTIIVILLLKKCAKTDVKKRQRLKKKLKQNNMQKQKIVKL